MLRVEQQVDPLDDALTDWAFGTWWEICRPRVKELQRLERERPNDLAVSISVTSELSKIRRYGAIRLVEFMIDLWREQESRPWWRLPPGGWLAEGMQRNYPDLRIDPRERGLDFPIPGGDQERFIGTFSEWLDHHARHLQEERHPTPSPFPPVTHPRSTDKDAVADLEDQVSANLKVLEDFGAAVKQFKENNSPCDLQPIFDDSRTRLKVPPGTIVYHQISSFPDAKRPYERRAEWSFRRHAKLQVGDIVRYNHIRSSTTNVWWLGNLGRAKPHWLNQEGEETGLRLELAPRQGLYIDDRAGDVIGTHLGSENELVLPSGTLWEVVGIADVVQPDPRVHESGNDRLRAIQMKEIDKADTGNGKVLGMTAPAQELGRVGSHTN